MPPDPVDTMAELRAVVEALGLDSFHVWVAYFALGGNAEADTVAGWMNTNRIPSPTDYAVLAAAVNQEVIDRGRHTTVRWTL